MSGRRCFYSAIAFVSYHIFIAEHFRFGYAIGNEQGLVKDQLLSSRGTNFATARSSWSRSRGHKEEGANDKGQMGVPL